MTIPQGLKDFLSEFGLETIGFLAFMLAAPVFAWQYPRGAPEAKPMNLIAATCILVAVGFLSKAFFKQGPRVSEVTPPPVLLPVKDYPPAQR